MSDYINTVDSMGDAAICTAFFEKTLEEITDTHCAVVGGYAFYEFKSLHTAIFANATSIEQYAFAHCSELATVAFPLSGSVGYYAFYECAKLKKVDLPRVTSLARYAFYKCTKLEALILRSTTLVTMADANALDYTAIKNGTGYIYVPGALLDSYKADSKWSTYANQFRRLEDYTVDGTITGEWQIPSVARKIVGRTITSFESEAITSVGQYAFYDCNKMTSVNMPNVTSVGHNAFNDCTKLVSVDIPIAKTIGQSAFQRCLSLVRVDLPSCTLVDQNAFSNCQGMKEINLPVVEDIRDNAFTDCKSMEAIRLPATPPKVPNSFERLNSACVFYVPTGSLAAYQAHSGWRKFTTTYSFVEEDRT